MVEILDCTLRDGSYAVNFGFTKEDTREISRDLDAAGIYYIEVGHGIGVGAQDRGLGMAAATDREYMSHAFGNWGMFAIPGTATLSDIRDLATSGAGFVRIGCDVDKVNAAEPFIKTARDAGLYVFSNIMKSYATECDDFAREASKCLDWGADCIYIVDSAGCMLPRDISLYAEKVRELRPDARLGFHGHNNLGMAVANSFACIEDGFHVIDTTLCGIGRGAGNAPTEQITALLGKEGYSHANILKILDIGEKYIRPLVGRSCPTQLDIMSGVYNFHSSYMPIVLDVSRKFRVDPRIVISKLYNVSVVNVTEEMVVAVAKTISRRAPRMEILPYVGGDQ